MSDQEKKAKMDPMSDESLDKVVGGTEIEFDPEPIGFPPISTACPK